MEVFRANELLKLQCKLCHAMSATSRHNLHQMYVIIWECFPNVEDDKRLHSVLKCEYSIATG